jgi:uncharacterized protein (DUF2141 family)
MKTIPILCWFLIIVLSPMISLGQDTTAALKKTGTLIVTVEKLKSNTGNVQIALFNNADSWDNKGKAYRGAVVPVSDHKATWIAEYIPFGEYGIRFFHDENSDNICNMNFFKMPKEQFGFSNNARATFGMPGFSKVKFLFEADSMQITIKPN